MKVIVNNAFHGTTANLVVRAQVISARRAKQLRRELCAEGCKCFSDNTQFLDANSENRQMRQLYASEREDGSILLESYLL